MTESIATQLLVNVPLQWSQSLRGHLLATAEANCLTSLLKPHFRNLESSTDAALQFIGLAGWLPVDLSNRLAWTVGRQGDSAVIRVGEARLGARTIRDTTRAVCPACLATDGLSRCEWELRAMTACPAHGIELQHKCCACGRSLTWASTFHGRCLCGHQLAQLPRQAASAASLAIARFVTQATLTSLGAPLAPEQVAKPGLALRIDRLLLVMDVVRMLLLPQVFPSNYLSVCSDELIAMALEEPGYLDFIWQRIFLHLSRRPETLAAKLLPGRTAAEIQADLSFPMKHLTLPSVAERFLVYLRRETPRQRRIRDRVFAAVSGGNLSFPIIQLPEEQV